MRRRDDWAVLGVFYWLFIIGMSTLYQAWHRNWIGVAAGVILMAFIAYVHADDFRPVSHRDPERGWYIVGSAPATRRAGTIALIVLCVAATIAGWLAPNRWYINQGTIGATAVLVDHEWWRFLTSPFLHANFMHIWMNMLALWYLGAELETLVGTKRLVTIYAFAALGGGAAVVLAGQEHTLGASGAIYGLMGANLFFAIRAHRFGFDRLAKRLLFASGIVIAINLLFSMAIPHISLAAHVGGLLTGFFVASIQGVPDRIVHTWELSNREHEAAHYTCDATGAVFYSGPARIALEAGWVSPRDLATAVDKDTLPQLVFVSDVDPVELLISCAVPPGER